MKTLALLLLAAAASAQQARPIPPNPDQADIDAAYAVAAGAARASRVAAHRPPAPGRLATEPTCDYGTELESRAFRLTLLPAQGEPSVEDFKYVSCYAAERYDLEPAYATRVYRAGSGRELVLVTYDSVSDPYGHHVGKTDASVYVYGHFIGTLGSFSTSDLAADKSLKVTLADTSAAGDIVYGAGTLDSSAKR